MSRRIENHPVLGKLAEQERVTFQFDDEKYEGFEGDTIASALLAHGIRTLREHEASGTPRGIYCNIGHCFECRVTVNGNANVRACLTPIKENMVVESGKRQASPFNKENEEDIPKTYAEFQEQEGKKHAIT